MYAFKDSLASCWFGITYGEFGSFVNSSCSGREPVLLKESEILGGTSWQGLPLLLTRRIEKSD